jgi:hypothetical protein
VELFEIALNMFVDPYFNGVNTCKPLPVERPLKELVELDELGK